MVINKKLIVLVCISSSLVIMLLSTHNIHGIFNSESSEEFKTYENPLYGINMKYPDDWRYYEKNGPENFFKMQWNQENIPVKIYKYQDDEKSYYDDEKGDNRYSPNNN